MSSPSSSEGIERTYTPVEIASLLRVEVKTVQGWLRDESHSLKGVKFKNMWRVKESDLRAFLQKGTG